MQVQQTFIHLKDMRFFAHHGVLPQERQTGAWFQLSLHIATNFSAALESDELYQTVSYADIYNKVKEEMAIPSKLLEHVAGRIAHRLFRDFPTINSINLQLYKENPPMGGQCDACGIEIHTQRDETD